MADIDWRGWTGWTSLSLAQGLGFPNAPNKPGAYAVAADTPISRAVGSDEYGILTIGESDDLHRRMTLFASCALSYGTEGHEAGWRFSFLRFERYFSFAKLRIRWKATETKKQANELEGKMLLAYLSKHLELPPLNYKFNWSMFEDGDWDLFDVMIGIKEPPAELPIDQKMKAD
jgi:hypothetical protein